MSATGEVSRRIPLPVKGGGSRSPSQWSRGHDGADLAAPKRQADLIGAVGGKSITSLYSRGPRGDPGTARGDGALPPRTMGPCVI